MKKFAEFGIKPKKNTQVFEVPKVSIVDIINCEIVVIAYQKGVKTKHGDNRYVVKIRYNNADCKFFTASDNLKDALDQIPADGFPFTETIKQQSFEIGNGKKFYFS
jgi:hypothetical protein